MHIDARDFLQDHFAISNKRDASGWLFFTLWVGPARVCAGLGLASIRHKASDVCVAIRVAILAIILWPSSSVEPIRHRRDLTLVFRRTTACGFGLLHRAKPPFPLAQVHIDLGVPPSALLMIYALAATVDVPLDGTVWRARFR